MADLAGSIFAGLLALYTADSGSGGLSEANGTATIRQFIRRGDANYDGRPGNWPQAVVDPVINEQRSWSNRHSEVLVRVTITFNRDENRSDLAQQNAVNARFFTVYDGQKMDAQSPFSFSVMSILRHFQGPSSGTELNYIYEISVRPMV